MSEENLESVRRVFEAAGRGDNETLFALYHPDVEVEARGDIGHLIGAGIYQGHEGVRRFYRAYYEAWDHVDFEIEELIDAGEQVFSVVPNRGRGRESGLELEFCVFGAWTITDGRVVRVTFFSSRDEALEAAGLSEPAASEEKLDLVRQGVEDVDAFWAMLDEYVVWDLRSWPSIPPDLDSVYVGREAVIKASRQYWGTWDDYSVEAEELIGAGPSVVVILRERGRGKGSGAPFERAHPQLWTFRGNRIIRWESFQRRAEALEAAGLGE